MNKDQYSQILRSELGYQTPPGSSFPAKYVSGWPLSLIYYVKLISNLTHASFPARRGTLDDDRWAFHSHRVVRIVESVGGKVNISGLESVSDQPGPVVYIGNHMSLVETLILPGIVLAFGRVNFVIKEELRHYPVLGSIFKALGLIAVSRKNPREDFKVVLREGHKFISNGGSVIIFPQATRSVGFDVQAFNTLGVKLASRAGVPVVPVAIKTDFHGNGKWIKDMGPIDPSKMLYFKFGEPMAVAGKGREAHRYVVEFISENLMAWGGTVVRKAEVGMRKSDDRRQRTEDG
ncbi:Acyl-CoA:1-acyl-sn-glycerol-3-phosphate acyltransferase (EC [Olavius sp. associated proteobacterium Delta 1]|nr:Acyl-CoA:1-acyl-sn-glycerol-3-phosphate acyltransferase (EC [Olavius sp. associated proteobacterium Delta 1]